MGYLLFKFAYQQWSFMLADVCIKKYALEISIPMHIFLGQNHLVRPNVYRTYYNTAMPIIKMKIYQPNYVNLIKAVKIARSIFSFCSHVISQRRCRRRGVQSVSRYSRNRAKVWTAFALQGRRWSLSFAQRVCSKVEQQKCEHRIVRKYKAVYKEQVNAECTLWCDRTKKVWCFISSCRIWD